MFWINDVNIGCFLNKGSVSKSIKVLVGVPTVRFQRA